MLRAALLDMYNGESNRGIPMLKSMLGRYANLMAFDHFDVRAKNELPDLSYNIYLFSGGPGDPLMEDGPWFKRYFDLIETLWRWNLQSNQEKKYVFFICHSFQMACFHFNLGEVTQRYKMSFGTYTVHKTASAKTELIFDGLPNPFYIADFRRYQVINPNLDRLRAMGARILCLEKPRPHVNFPRAIMAIRFSPEIIGTQFHPEADPGGLLGYFREPDRRKSIVDEHGEQRYEQMIHDLSHPMKIQRTFDTVIPNFLEQAAEKLYGKMVI